MNETQKVKYNVVDDFPTKGVRFIDFTPTLSDPIAFQDMVSALIIQGDIQNCDYIISPEARGFIWGSAVAFQTRKPLLIARKVGKLPPDLVGVSVSYETEYSIATLELEEIDLTNKKVVYIDDVYATGGTYDACKQLVSQLGGKVTNGAVLYNVGINEDETMYAVYEGGDL